MALQHNPADQATRPIAIENVKNTVDGLVVQNDGFFRIKTTA